MGLQGHGVQARDLALLLEPGEELDGLVEHLQRLLLAAADRGAPADEERGGRQGTASVDARADPTTGAGIVATNGGADVAPADNRPSPRLRNGPAC